MDNIDKSGNTGKAKRIPLITAVILSLLTALFSTLCATSGGVLFIVIAVAFEALLLIAGIPFNVIFLLPVPLAMADILTGNFVQALCALLPFAGAVCLKICFVKRSSLSVTLSALSVCFIFIFTAYISVNLNTVYGSVADGFNTVKSELGAQITNAFKAMSSLASTQLPGGEAFVFTDEMISLLKKQIIMLSPAFFIMACEIAAYVCEKLLCLLSRIFSFSFVTKRKGKVTLSPGFAIIYAVSYLLSSVAAGDNLFYYCAENLMLILLPLASVAGIHCLFGSEGFFRKSGKTGFKIFTVAICVMALLSSPVMLFALFALWGSIYVIGKAIFMRMLEKRDGDDTEN